MSATEVSSEFWREGHSQSLNELADALAKAQAKIRTAAKDATNPHFRSRYADLASVWEACREPLSENGLAVIQQPCGRGAQVGVTTTIMHRSGQYMTSTIYAEAKDPGPQAIGSVLTYLRRYSLAAVAGVAPDEDDGEAGESRPRPANDNASARRAVPPQGTDGPPATASPGPSLASQRKYRRLADGLGLSGEAARARVNEAIGRRVSGLQELTQAEMDHVIARMEGETNASA